MEEVIATPGEPLEPKVPSPITVIIISCEEYKSMYMGILSFKFITDDWCVMPRMGIEAIALGRSSVRIGILAIWRTCIYYITDHIR